MIVVNGRTWVSVAEGAEYLGIDASGVRSWIRHHKVTPVKFSTGKLLLDLDDLFDVQREADLAVLKCSVNGRVA